MATWTVSIIFPQRYSKSTVSKAAKAVTKRDYDTDCGNDCLIYYYSRKDSAVRAARRLRTLFKSKSFKIDWFDADKL